MADGFLGRWSKRKLDVKEGRAVEPEPAIVSEPPAAQPAVPPPVSQQVQEPAPQAPPPTLEDTRVLTPESDFKPFMASNVAPEVKNAAMRKLFADPHFNVMDRLDIYIDDYSQSDPIPPAMLRQMASAKFLKLFDEEEEKPAAVEGRDDADSPAGTDVAQSGLCNELPGQLDSPALPASRTDNDDPDLRLQPDHAAPGQKPGGSA